MQSRILLSMLFVMGIQLHAQSFWQPTNGPYMGGRGHSGVAVKSNGDIFVVVNSTDVFRSTNAGVTWTRVLATTVDLSPIGISPAGYIFTGQAYPYGNKFYRSIDNGNTWDTLSLSGGTYQIAFTSNGTIFVGTAQGSVVRSTDNGGSWATKDPGSVNTGLKSIAINHLDVIFVAKAGGKVMRSQDNGEHWTQTNLPCSEGSLLAVNSNNRLVSTSFQGGFVYQSSNEGSSYDSIPIHNPSAGLWRIWELTTLPDPNGTFVLGGYRYPNQTYGFMFVSTDNGLSWNQNPRVEFPHGDFTGNSAGQIFMANYYYGVIRSNDLGNTWFSIGAVPSGLEIHSLAISRAGSWNGHIFASSIASSAGIYRSTDGGDSWRFVHWDTTGVGFNNVSVAPNGYVFCSGYANTNVVTRSTDDGETWTQTNIGLSAGGNASVTAGADGYVFYRNDNGYARSTNYGNTWQPIAGVSGNAFGININGDVYLGGFRSTDHGVTWGSSTTGFSPTRWAFDSAGSVVYGLGGRYPSEGLRRSMNNGATWENIDLPSGTGTLSDIAVNSAGNVFVARSDGNGGLFRSTNRGTTWDSVVTTGLPNKGFYSLALDANGYLYAGLYSDKVYRTRQTTITSIANEVAPLHFSLSQNYPNPFNPSTTIEFALPKQLRVRLEVYNITGERVAILVDDVRPVGSYKEQFNAAGLASGIYLYQLTAGNFVQIRKLVVLK